jgi:hypothetical protein
LTRRTFSAGCALGYLPVVDFGRRAACFSNAYFDWVSFASIRSAITAMFKKANFDVLRLLGRYSSKDLSMRRYVRRAKDPRLLNPFPENYGTIPSIASAE